MSLTKERNTISALPRMDAPAQRYHRSRYLREVLSTVLIYMACIALGLMFIFPTLWMISTSLKDLAQIYAVPIVWIPNPPMWQNYTNALQAMPFERYLLNSLYIVVMVAIGTVFSSALVAYGFARFDAPGKNILFLIVLSTMMLPYAVTLIPQFIMFSTIQWTNTYRPLTIPAYFGSPFFIFLLRQFFLTIPRELDEAAKIDGCSPFGIFTRIIMPLSKPALVTVVVFTVIWNWNDYLAPLVYLSSKEKFTVAVGLSFFRGEHSTDWGMLMAASVMSTIPSLLIFLFAQRYFVQGIATTGLKG
jgi:multiple sugar transport system permease protein